MVTLRARSSEPKSAPPLDRSCLARRTFIRRILGAASTLTLALCAAAAPLAIAPAFAQARAQPISIEAGPLDAALLKLSADTGVLVLVDPSLVKGKTAPALKGAMTPQAALERLLRGTGLTFRRERDGSAVVVRAEASRPSRVVRAEPASARAPPAVEASTIAEVIVTAEKRAENVHDIPSAISAFSGETLAKAGVEDVRELQYKVPSLQLGASGNQVLISMRGIGVEVFEIGSEAGVVVSQDGVPFLRNVLMDADLLDVDRVEVLRGPQGTIAGRNATGGAINIHSKLPTEDFEAGIKATLGNYNRFATEGYLSGPILGGGILGRLAFGADHADGWLVNTFLEEDLEDRKKVHARASFAADLGESTRALLRVDWIRDRSIRQGDFSFGRIRPDTPSVGEFYGGPDIDEDHLTVEADTPSISDKDQLGVTFNLVWTLSPSATVTATTGYVAMDLRRSYDCDGTRFQACALPHLDVETWQVSQEVTLAADLTERMDLILGGLYIRELAKDYAVLGAGANGIPVGSLDLLAKQRLRSYAAYAQLRYRLSDDLRLSLGARYTDDWKRYSHDGNAFGPSSVRGEDSWSALTPRIALDYTPTEDLTLFASASRGFKAGGFNTFSAPVNPFRPETVWSYELGAKVRLFDNRIRAAGSVFYMDYTDLQQNVFGLAGSPFPKIQNAGQAEIKGAELEVEALIAQRLRLNLSGTWLDAEYTELRTADNIFPELGERDPSTGLNVRDLSGNRLPRSPRWQFSASGEYTLPLSDRRSAVLRADYSWRSHVFFSMYNHEAVAQDAYGLLNLYAAVEDNDETWRLSAFVHNALDERYRNLVIPTGIGLAPVPLMTGTLGPPRMYGVSLEYRF